MKTKSMIIGLISAIMLTAPASTHTIEITLRSSDLLNQGNQLIRVGEGEEARELLLRALDSNLNERQTARAHNSLCAAFILDEHWTDAMKHCNRAIRINPSNWRFYNNRGNIYLETGDIDRAIAEYERGLKLAPSSRTIKFNIDLAKARAAMIGYDGA